MSQSGPHISVVSPVYKGEEFVDELVRRISETVRTITDTYEILLVDDNSPDNSWEKIEVHCRKDARVKGIKLSRNFGQHSAIMAGLSRAKGTWVVVLDCDLQDRPEEIVALYKKAKDGYDVVLAKRAKRQDSFFKRQASRFFYLLLGYLTDTKQDPDIANFGIYNKNVVDAVLSMNDFVAYFPAMVRWVGFRSTSIPVTHAARAKGKSSYNLRSLLKLGIQVILSFSDKPLRLAVKFGLFVSSLAFFFALFYLYRYFRGEIEVLGFISIIVSIWFFAGIIISIMGVLGLYIGRIFDQAKNRPRFIIENVLNNDN